MILRRFWSRWREALILVQPETVVRWYRAGFMLYWTWLSRHPIYRSSSCKWETLVCSWWCSFLSYRLAGRQHVGGDPLDLDLFERGDVLGRDAMSASRPRDPAMIGRVENADRLRKQHGLTVAVPCQRLFRVKSGRRLAACTSCKCAIAGISLKGSFG